MTTLFSALPMPKGRGLLRRPDFLRRSTSPSSPETRPLFSRDDLDSDSPDKKDADLAGLNTALVALVQVFPDVQPEVFREMLVNISEESRLAVVTEHLLKDKSKWVQGRHKSTAQESTADAMDPRLAAEDTFRSRAYRHAVKAAFYQEFKSLSHSTIRAVMAEHNCSYTQTRPVLEQLSSKTWRSFLNSLWPKKKPTFSEAGENPLVTWQSDLTGNGEMLPYLQRTASSELNAELYITLIAPILAQRAQDMIAKDLTLAVELNEQEAETADAMYDCECCYTPSAFEQISTCDSGCHFICFRCIRHAVNESLFGQGWARNIDLEKVTVRCLAPSLEECRGSVPHQAVKRAIQMDKDGEQIWTKLEERAASEALLQCRLPLLRCPFCSYAEVDEIDELELKSASAFGLFLSKISISSTPAFLGLLLALILYPVLCLLWPLPAYILSSPYASSTQLVASRVRVVRRRRGLRFNCRSPKCATPSCSLCSARWTDPHICNETSIASLRQAIEAATTSSIKRTCPKCQLSFVKSSGCNKLVCNCGYAMCYVCRNEIGKEGYGHFCQHFRERGGRCSECDRCDLYIVEDEESVIRRAAETAETEWRVKEGKEVFDKSSGLGASGIDRFGKVAKEVITGTKQTDQWGLEGVLDAMMEALLA